jgi:hypothetical protein
MEMQQKVIHKVTGGKIQLPLGQYVLLSASRGQLDSLAAEQVDQHPHPPHLLQVAGRPQVKADSLPIKL